jgi:hypothetical protein
MNALELAKVVAANPTVRAFDRSLSRFHARMMESYGPDFMEPLEKGVNGIPINWEGVDRWTQADRNRFYSLTKAAKTYRASIRSRFAA